MYRTYSTGNISSKNSNYTVHSEKYMRAGEWGTPDSHAYSWMSEEADDFFFRLPLTVKLFSILRDEWSLWWTTKNMLWKWPRVEIFAELQLVFGDLLRHLRLPFSCETDTYCMRLYELVMRSNWWHLSCCFRNATFDILLLLLRHVMFEIFVYLIWDLIWILRPLKNMLHVKLNTHTQIRYTLSSTRVLLNPVITACRFGLGGGWRLPQLTLSIFHFRSCIIRPSLDVIFHFDFAVSGCWSDH